MWVCRAGQKAQYYDFFLDTSKIYIPWDGYDYDLSAVPSKEALRILVEKETGHVNRTSVSNWMGQLNSFTFDMNIGDYVLIPACYSRSYALAIITGEYEYKHNENNTLHHARSISVVGTGVPRSIFPQDIIYSLGAYRTLFRVKQSEQVLMLIRGYLAENRQ